MNASRPETRHRLAPGTSRPFALARVVLYLATAVLVIDLAIK